MGFVDIRGSALLGMGSGREHDIPCIHYGEKVLLFVVTAYAEEKDEEKGFKGYDGLWGSLRGQAPRDV